MASNYSKLVCVVVLLAMAPQLSNAAGKKKKLPDSDSPSQTQIVSKSTGWAQQPTSVRGIELNQPLSKSVKLTCPKKSYGSVDENSADQLNALCHNDYIFAQTGSYSIYGFKVPPIFKTVYINTLDKTIDGGVGHIQATFNSTDFFQVKEMLTLKYGQPFTTEIEKLKTKGGAEFDNAVLKWNGDKVSIKLESLASRGYSGNSFYEYGTIDVTTDEYLNKKVKAINEDVQQGAAGL